MGEELVRMHHRTQLTRKDPSIGFAFAGDQKLAQRTATISERRMKVQTVDPNIRIVAEQLCRNVERKYAREREVEREKERNETERRLAQLHDSYNREIKANQRKFDRSHEHLKNQLVDAENKLLRDVDLKLKEREMLLEEERGKLITWTEDLNHGKNELEGARRRLRLAVDSESERCRRERERLGEWEKRLREEEANMTAMLQDKTQRERDNSAILRLQTTAAELRGKLIEEENERNRLQMLLMQMEVEAGIAKNSHLRQLDECRKLREQLREKEDYDEIRWENDRLAAQVRAFEKRRDDRKDETLLALASEKASVVNEQYKIALSLVREKMKSVAEERDYWRKEYKTQREASIRKAPKIIQLPKNVKEESDIEDIDGLSQLTSQSSFEDELDGIQRRIQKIDFMSSSLEETLEGLIQQKPVKIISRSIGKEPIHVDHDPTPRSPTDAVVPSWIVESKEKSPVSLPPPTAHPASPAPAQQLSVADAPNQKENGAGGEAQDESLAGIDPLMAHYMKLVMQSRKESQNEMVAEKEVEPRKEDPSMDDDEEDFVLEAAGFDGNEEAFQW